MSFSRILPMLTVLLSACSSSRSEEISSVSSPSGSVPIGYDVSIRQNGILLPARILSPNDCYTDPLDGLNSINLEVLTNGGAPTEMCVQSNEIIRRFPLE